MGLIQNPQRSAGTCALISLGSGGSRLPSSSSFSWGKCNVFSANPQPLLYINATSWTQEQQCRKHSCSERFPLQRITHLYKTICPAGKGLKNMHFENNPFESWHERELKYSLNCELVEFSIDLGWKKSLQTVSEERSFEMARLLLW